MIHRANCFDILPSIPDGSIDFIITDPPYTSLNGRAKTECSWDKAIDLPKLFGELNRIVKPKGAIAVFATQPFTTDVINANRDYYKYCWYWVKPCPYGFTHARNKPMTKVEDICIFSKGSVAHAKFPNRMTYYPQGIVEGKVKKIKPSQSPNIQPRPRQWGKEYVSYTNFPTNVLNYSKPLGKQSLHPSEKPVELLKYLIKTYTVMGHKVLDCFAGSGSTGVAAKETGREYILIEQEDKYYQICKERCES